MCCTDAGHHKGSKLGHFIQRKLAGEVSMKLVERHIRHTYSKRIHDRRYGFKLQTRARSRPAKLDQRVVIKTNPCCDAKTNAVVQRCSSLCSSRGLNVECPSKPAANERCNLKTLEFKALRARGRHELQTASEAQQETKDSWESGPRHTVL